MSRRTIALIFSAAFVVAVLFAYATERLTGKEASSPAVTDAAALFGGYTAAEEPNGDLAKVTWPHFVLDAGPEIKKLYEFQIEHGDLMRYIPCFCGCGGEDSHRSNRDCYVRKVFPDGRVLLDAMAPT